jgi:hypothetical protein
MMVTTTASQQINASVMEGNDQKAVFAASIRPGRGININMEIVDTTYAAENASAIAEAFDAFYADVITRAEAANVPVNVPVSGVTEPAASA